MSKNNQTNPNEIETNLNPNKSRLRNRWELNSIESSDSAFYDLSESNILMSRKISFDNRFEAEKKNNNFKYDNQNLNESLEKELMFNFFFNSFY